MPQELQTPSASQTLNSGAGAASPSITVEDVTSMMSDPEFQKQPFEERSADLETALPLAFRDLAQHGMSREDHVAFGELAAAARAKNAEGWGEYAKRKVKGAGSTLADLGKGLGAVAYETNAPHVLYNTLTGHPEKTLEALKTIGSSALSHLESRSTNADEWMRAKTTAEGRALDAATEDMFSRIDRGEMPFDSAEARADFVRSENEKLRPLREKYYSADLSGGDPDASAPTPAEAERRGAAAKQLTEANPLTHPENVSLLAAYMATRNPEAKAQLKANLFRTSNVTLANANREATLNSPGARQFERTFGKGSAQHLYSGADPVNAAMLALPFLRGASVAGATASTAEKAATFAAEQTAFGVDSAIQQNPSDPHYAENIGNMFLLGGAMHGAGRVLKAVTGKGEATENAEPSTVEPVAADKTLDKNTDAIAGELFNNTGREGASDAEFSALDGHAKTAMGVEESTPAVAAPEPPAPVEPLVVAPSIPETPPQITFRTFDENGKLKATKEAPHEEAMKELRGRESMLQKILDCLTKKAA